MPKTERQQVIKNIAKLRPGRTVITLFNFDRACEPAIPGLSLSFNSETKEPLFRVLKESLPKTKPKIDLCLYTRGGDTNSVWPIVSLIREFDPDFEVLVPFRCHSGGTMVALAAKRIVLGRLAELSPIDPTTGNQFNPADETRATQGRLAISVEDVRSFADFFAAQMHLDETEEKRHHRADVYGPIVGHLLQRIHPLALGNVHRVHQLVRQLATRLLEFHRVSGRKVDAVIEELTTKPYSHLHMFNRHESKSILGEQIEFASDKLDQALDNLLRKYEDDFQLRRPFFLGRALGDKLSDNFRFISGAIESEKWSYLFETKSIVSQSSQIPPNVQIQLPAGQPMPLVQGLGRIHRADIVEQGWVANKEPKGVSL